MMDGAEHQFPAVPSGLKPTCTEGAAIADMDEESVVAITAATTIFFNMGIPFMMWPPGQAAEDQ